MAKRGNLQHLRKIKEIKAPYWIKPVVRLFRFVLKKFNGLIGCRPGRIDFLVFERLHDNHIERFDQSREQKKFLELKKHLINLRLERIRTGNVFINNYIRIALIDLDKADPSKLKGLTIDQVLSRLAKYQGVAIIKKKEITVVEFENLVKEYVAAASRKE